MADDLAPLLHTIRGSAKRLGVSESTVWRLLRAKKLKPTRILGRTLVAEAELQRLVHEAAEDLGAGERTGSGRSDAQTGRGGKK